MAEMKIQLSLAGKEYALIFPGTSVAIPLQFNGPQPNTYGVDIARSQAYASGGWVGDTRQGGSCNFETYNFTPHCNGTHTECVGHISDIRLSIDAQLQESLIPATVISVAPVKVAETNDSYDPPLQADDRVIDRAQLETALKNADSNFLEALLIRTLPNSETKMARDYMKEVPAFFSLEAMAFIAQFPVKHLLVDMPSVDRLFDEGKLSAHHIFWNLPAGSHEVDPNRIPPQTITEMIFVPEKVQDGKYLLNLQIAAFVSDAAPSRPVLYSLNEI